MAPTRTSACLGEFSYFMAYEGHQFPPKMPCVRPNLSKQHRFLSHFPPGSMRCRFSPELVTLLSHAMMNVFPKSENESTCGSPSSPPSPLTPTAPSPQLVPKPSGEVARIGRGGYKLKDVLERQHGWEYGLYDKIRVQAFRSYASVTYAIFRKGYACWLPNTWTHPLAIPLKLRINLILYVRWWDRPLLCRRAVDVVRQVSEEFPILVKFEENWVIHNYLRIFLKNSSQKAKKDQQQKDRELEAAAKGKNKVRGCT